ncbi:MAG: MBL fold metallo-hydrolase [Deltaproteobacteria bacterium]|nr:MBL fold metallo-hydrolase [Deltaproteobacteria bacterium]
MRIHTLVVGALQVNCYIVACEETRQAIVIDPGDEGERIWEVVSAEGYELKQIVNTHGHFDHLGGNKFLVEKSGAQLLIHELDLNLLKTITGHAAKFGLEVEPSPVPDRFLSDGDILKIGRLEARVLHTPGHSPGGICLLMGEHLFSGDTLFARSVGRTDLPGGDFATLLEGIRRQLLPLPDATVVHPGHGPDTTIGEEKALNSFINSGESEFL